MRTRLTDQLDIMGGFDAFYAAYPRKRAPQDARKAWRQTAAFRPPDEELLRRLDVIKRYDYSKRPKDKIPYPASWLRAHSWEDADDFKAPAPKEPLPGSDGSTFRKMALRKAAELGAPTHRLERCPMDELGREFRKATGRDFMRTCLPHMVRR